MPHILSYILVGLFGLLSMALDPVYAAPTSEDSGEGETAVLFAQAKAHIDAEDFAAALPLLKILTLTQSENAEAWHLCGLAHCKLGDMAAAATAYDVALRLNPGDLAALHFLAAYPAAGLTDKAKAQQRIL